MKKLFTLIALLACFLGVKAETVVDLEIDGAFKSFGWASDAANERVTFEDGIIHFKSTEATANSWDAQMLLPGVPNLDNDALYTITLKIKGSVEGTMHSSFSGSNTPGDFPITTEWATVVLEGCQNNPDAQYFANSGCLNIQCGDYVGEWWISYIKITHEEKASSRPVEWIQLITNGNAEAAWPAWSLEKNDEGVNVNWRGDRAGEICAWALTMGKNNDSGEYNGTTLDGRARPFPADIEAEVGNESNHVFAAHVEQIAKIDDDASIGWSNQFWIQAPKGMKDGTKVHLKFRYKAEKAATVSTQIHKQHPSDYLHYIGIGDVNFTSEWQEFDQTVTFSGAQAGGWSVAFNLTSGSTVENPQEPNIFYFDDISWEVMKLDEGWFVASSNSTTGIEYDYDNAIEFVDGVDPNGESCKVATVGTQGKQDTWVNELMISTVRGENAAFKGATIKPVSGTIKGNDPDNWQDYTAGSQYKIKLPAAGVWKIFLVPESETEKPQILFMQLEGDEIVQKEPVEIVTNTTEFVVNAVERDWKPAKDDGTPADGEDGIGTGQPWDNQFWIAANRNLEKDEVTIIKFKYKSSIDAKVSTQAHKVGDDGKPCTYLNWQGINISQFAAGDWVDFEQEFTIPEGDNGMRSIVFNLSEIKGACDYYIKDVQWYLKDDSNAEGKTTENLINADNTENFWIKVKGVNGGAPYLYGTDPSGINSIVKGNTNSSAAIYNLAGQRVSGDYKGIVVKDGKKYLAK